MAAATPSMACSSAEREVDACDSQLHGGPSRSATKSCSPLVSRPHVETTTNDHRDRLFDNVSYLGYLALEGNRETHTVCSAGRRLNPLAAVQQPLGDEVDVVSAFQNASAHQLRDVGDAIDCDVLVCGDDPGLRRSRHRARWGQGPARMVRGPDCQFRCRGSADVGVDRPEHGLQGSGIRITGLPAQSA